MRVWNSLPKSMKVGRGMLSVIVVHKEGDMQPGPGFFELAGELGRDTSDILVLVGWKS